MEHVLVPLDGSPLAEQALPHAESLADRLTLVMAIELPDIYPMISPSPPILPGEVEDYNTRRNRIMLHGEAYLTQIAKKLSAAKVEVEVVASDDPAETIVKVAAEKQVDAIVMSTHGRTGLRRWLMGSVTQKVLQASPCPVVVIPNRTAAQD
jgi:nucleotide-binding universal stress UspA family protein